MSAVLSHAGAAPRDSVDALVLAQASSFGLLGELYRDQNKTGLPNDGYGEIAGGAPLPPAAGGFPLAWAAAYGVSPTDPSAGNAPFAGTEYTVVEAWVNSLVLPHPWTSPLPPGVDGGTAGGVFFNPLVDSGGWLLAAGEGGGRCAVDLSPDGHPRHDPRRRRHPRSGRLGRRRGHPRGEPVAPDAGRRRPRIHVDRHGDALSGGVAGAAPFWPVMMAR